MAVKCTVSHKDVPVFADNSGVCERLVRCYVPVETGMNTLQLTYLMARWHRIYLRHTARHEIAVDSFLENVPSRRLFATFTENGPMFVFLLAITFVYKFWVRKLFSFPCALIKILSSELSLSVFNSKKSLFEVKFHDMRCDVGMIAHSSAHDIVHCVSKNATILWWLFRQILTD